MEPPSRLSCGRPEQDEAGLKIADMKRQAVAACRLPAACHRGFAELSGAGRDRASSAFGIRATAPAYFCDFLCD